MCTHVEDVGFHGAGLALLVYTGSSSNEAHLSGALHNWILIAADGKHKPLATQAVHTGELSSGLTDPHHG